jgi:hypothetical protein
MESAPMLRAVANDRCFAGVSGAQSGSCNTLLKERFERRYCNTGDFAVL